MTVSTLERDPSAQTRVFQTRRVFLASSLCGMGTLCALSCSTFSRLTSKAPTADARKIDEATSMVKNELERLSNASKRETPTICFLGVSGAGAGSFSTATREQLENEEKIRVLSQSKMQDAIKQSGVKANNLFIPTEQKKFVKELGEPIDYILAGYIETVPIDESDEDKGKKDVFRLELVEIESSQKSSFVVDL